MNSASRGWVAGSVTAARAVACVGLRLILSIVVLTCVVATSGTSASDAATSGTTTATTSTVPIYDAPVQQPSRTLYGGSSAAPVGAAKDCSRATGNSSNLFVFVVAAADGAATAGRDAAKSCLTNSFTGDTPVTMADGSTKPIKAVKVGDKVIATDPLTGTTKAEPIVALIRHTGKHVMVLISLADGSVLDSTDGHPIWDATTGTFTGAADLHVGDKIETSNGQLITISALTDYSANLTAYNLQIDQIHTYYAGTTPVLVHNSCGPLRPNQMNRAIQRGQAPRGITRIDTPKIPNEKLHATFEDGSALNMDGTWKHGGVTLTRSQASWLESNGWTLP